MNDQFVKGQMANKQKIQSQQLTKKYKLKTTKYSGPIKS